MKTLFARAASLILVFLIFFSLTSCTYSTELVSCEEIVRAIAENEVGIPAGKIYSASAGEGEDDYIPDSLVNSLFGEGGRLALFDGWVDCAFFMPSSSHPCEIVAILCDTPETAKDTARLLCRRLNTIRNVKGGSQNINTTDLAVYLDSAEVTISRNYVLLIISSDTAAAKKCALAMIG